VPLILAALPAACPVSAGSGAPGPAAARTTPEPELSRSGARAAGAPRGLCPISCGG